MAEQNITLSPGESKVVSFEAIPAVAKTYHVSVDGLTGSFKAVAPPLAIELSDYIRVLGVEGIPFTKVGTETFVDWDAFGKCLDLNWGPNWILDGVGLARCMQAKGVEPVFVGGSITNASMSELGQILRQCGVEHPEYLSAFANTVPPPEDVWMGSSGLGWPLTVGQIITTELCTYEVLGWVDWDNVHVRITWLVPWWYRFPHASAVRLCLKPPFTGPTATLKTPIVMDPMRGVTVNIEVADLSRFSSTSFPMYCSAWLWYEPQFDAEMPPPAFGDFYAAVVGRYPDQIYGGRFSIPITTCFGRGYYYPGIYNGRIQLSLSPLPEYGEFGGGTFRVKNLVKVTGTGTV